MTWVTRNGLFYDSFGQGSRATLIGTGSSTGSGTTVTVPGGTEDGDLVVMGVMTVNSTPNASGPTGGSTWNQMYRFDSSTNEYHAAYWKVAGSSEPASWTLTQSGSEMSIGVAVFRSGGSGLWGFSASDDSLTPGTVVGHPLGLQVLIYVTQDSTTLSAPSNTDLTTAISVAPGTGDNCQVLMLYRDTTWAGDVSIVRCGGSNTSYTGAMNAVFYPS